MQIHRVKKGDTVYSISEEYGVSTSKIIENNGLENKNRLCIGQELLILTPTRSYTVKAGDTLGAVAMRFGTKTRELIRANPSLNGKGAIYAGDVIAIKNESESFGCAAANGFFYHGCTEEKLIMSLPYLTYVTVASVMSSGKGFREMFDGRRICEIAKKNGKVPLLRIYDVGSGEYCTDKGEGARFTEAIIGMAKDGGYSGIVLSAYRAAEENAEAFGEFLVELRKRMIGCDLILFTEIDQSTPAVAADFSDGSIFYYDKLTEGRIPSFDEGEVKTFSTFADLSESTKVFIDIPSLAFAGDKYITVNEALAIAYANGKEIVRDERSLTSHFEIGKRRIIFESMENIKAKLELVAELGFMGISFDIMRVPTSTLMLYNSVFKTLSFSSAYNNNI